MRISAVAYFAIFFLIAACVRSAGEIQTQTVNGITMQASNFRIENRQLKLDLCFDMPDDGPWIEWKASLKSGQHTSQLFQIDLIELRKPAINGQQEVMTSTEDYFEPDKNNGLGRRCDILTFSEVINFSGPATITIEAIVAEPGQGGVCEAAYLQRVNDELDKYDPALEANCFIESSEGGGSSSGLILTGKPENMTQQEGENILFSNEFFLDAHGVRGPWVFNVVLDKRMGVILTPISNP